MESDHSSVHIKYDQSVLVYHDVVAELVCKYTADGDRLIDIGCGVGHLLSRVVAKGRALNIVAADIDENCLRITAERVAAAETVLIGQVSDLLGAYPAFDIAVMSHFVEHLNDPISAVRTALQLLRPGGILILAVPNPLRPTVIWKSLLKRHYVNRGHVFAWDRSHWMNFVENILGLHVIEYSQDYVELPKIRRFRSVRALEQKLSKVFPWFAFSHIVVVRKQ